MKTDFTSWFVWGMLTALVVVALSACSRSDRMALEGAALCTMHPENCN